MNSLNYDANTGWNALGTGLFNGQGAFDESMQPKYRRVFEAIEGEPLRSPSSIIDQDILTDALNDFANTRSAFGTAPNTNLTQNVLDGALGALAFGGFSDNPIEGALAGKYLNFF
jgi:hypothetical protein